MVDKLTLTVEAERVGHGAFDIVDSPLQRAPRALAHGMNSANVEQLINSTNDFVECVFELEISDQHGELIAVHWRTAPNMLTVQSAFKNGTLFRYRRR